MKVKVTSRYLPDPEQLDNGIEPGKVYETIEMPEWMQLYKIPPGSVWIMGEQEEECLLAGEWEYID